jgi:hypothetical protein
MILPVPTFARADLTPWRGLGKGRWRRRWDGSEAGARHLNSRIRAEKPVMRPGVGRARRDRVAALAWCVLGCGRVEPWITRSKSFDTIMFKGISLDFSQQYLQATLIVSLLSVWVLVGLFYYLNRYTKREYFTVWTAAWLFYALWLTLSLTVPDVAPGNFLFTLKQWCVAISAVFLLWGSLRFLSLPVRQSLFGLFMLFLMVWTFVSPQILTDVVKIQLPVFILVGLGSTFAGVCFYRLRKKMPFVGAGMLSLGFLLWGLYLVSYPFTQRQGYENLYSAGFLVAAVLQLFIAVSMIVLVLEEVRYNAEQVLAEIATVKSEKEALQVKVLTTEEQCRNLYDQVRLTEGVQKAYEELRRPSSLTPSCC